jgi:YD repeat-containing protein
VYDALNRLTHKGYPDATGVDYVYDLAGKIKQATDPTGTYGFAYDNMGRLIGTTTHTRSCREPPRQRSLIMRTTPLQVALR